jgi:hypothetical protein
MESRMFGLPSRRRTLELHHNADLLIARMNADMARMRQDREADEITKPLMREIREAYYRAQRGGHRPPTILFLGEKQWQLFSDRQDKRYNLEKMPTHIRGMKIVWTQDADHVSVKEERKYAWV